MRLFVVPLAVAALSLHASVIDSGAILNRYNKGGDTDDTWSVRLSSSDGNYSVFFHTGGWVDTVGPISTFVHGYPISFLGFMSGFISPSGSATVNGVYYPSVNFGGTYFPPGSNSSVFYRSTIKLQSAAFDPAPGSFAVPFTMSGTIRAVEANGSSLLIDDAIMGSGTLYFSMRETAGPGSPLALVTSGFLGDPTLPRPPEMQWVPMPVPEPSAWVLMAGGLMLTGLARLRHGRSKLESVTDL